MKGLKFKILRVFFIYSIDFPLVIALKLLEFDLVLQVFFKFDITISLICLLFVRNDSMKTVYVLTQMRVDFFCHFFAQCVPAVRTYNSREVGLHVIFVHENSTTILSLDKGYLEIFSLLRKVGV